MELAVCDRRQELQGKTAKQLVEMLVATERDRETAKRAHERDQTKQQEERLRCEDLGNLQLFLAQETLDRVENRFVVNTSHPDYPDQYDYHKRVLGDRALKQQEDRLFREKARLEVMKRDLQKIENAIPKQVMTVRVIQQLVDEKMKKKKDDALTTRKTTVNTTTNFTKIMLKTVSPSNAENRV